MTFYSQISANKRSSVFLAIIVGALLGVLGFAIGYALSGSATGGLIATLIAVAIAFFTSIGSYFVGDKLVLAASQAKEVDATTAPQLMNVVQELTVAAGIPMPKVYVIDDTAPNAFATGRDPQHASIAVTSGLLQKMDREELQGVLGHELSHIRNYDIRFTLLVGVLVGGVALLSSFFLRYTFWFGGGRKRGQRQRGGGGLQIVFFVLAIVLAVVAPDRRPRRATGREPPARVPRRCVVGRADPQPARAGAGAGDDRERQGGPRGRLGGDPAPLLHEPDQEVREAGERPVLDPPAHRRPDQSPPRTDRRATLDPADQAALTGLE